VSVLPGLRIIPLISRAGLFPMTKRLLVVFIVFTAFVAAAAGCVPQVDLSKKSARSAATLTPFLPKATFTDTPPPPVVDQAESTPAGTDGSGKNRETAPTETLPATAQASATSASSATQAATQTITPALTSTDPPPTTTSAPKDTSPPPATKTDKPPTAQPTDTPHKDTQKTIEPSATPKNTAAPTQPTEPTATPIPPTDTPRPAGCNFSGNAGYESKVVELINKERKKRGLAPLSMHSSLRKAARRHSKDMACNDPQPISHTGTDSSTLGSRLSAAGYSYSYAAENIAASSSPGFSPASVVSGWMNSPGHKDNILNKNMKHIGVGFRYAENDDSPLDAYYTADFARP